MAILGIRSKDFSVSGLRYRGSESNHEKQIVRDTSQAGFPDDSSRRTGPLGPSVPPPPRGADQAEGHDAEPEVDNQAEIQLEQPVSGRGRKGGHKNVVGRVAQQHREQRLHEVGRHRQFRHRNPLNGAAAASWPLRTRRTPCYHSDRPDPMLELSTPVQYIKGIGPRLAEVLSAKGIATVADLLFYLPFRYEDRLNPRGIAELRSGEMATVIAEVRNSGLFRPRRMPIFQMTAGQGRARLKCLWFNGTYLRDRFKPGQMIALYGKVEADRNGELQITQPQFEILGDPAEAGSTDGAEQKVTGSLEVGRIVPIYES